VTDSQETIDGIIKASDFPLSIIVVGVGGANFKEMEVTPDQSLQSCNSFVHSSLLELKFLDNFAHKYRGSVNK
jgi:hypothetical protein